MEKGANQTLPFLDIEIEKENDQCLTSICRKPTLQVSIFAVIHFDHQNAKPT